MSGERWSVRHDPGADSQRARLAADALAGLWADPPSLPPRWFYDEKGSLLFEEITTLPEYYPTRVEERLLAEGAAAIVADSGASVLVELGAGSARKTRLLLDALVGARPRALFVPLDVSVSMLQATAAAVSAEYPNVRVRALAADFDDPLPALPGPAGHRLIAFLGSTIGNLLPAARARFLARVRAVMSPGDCFLLGADLVKDPRRLVAAYDDAQGVTAAFNRNVIEVLARELGAELDPEDFSHVVRWNAAEERIEMWLRARRWVRAHFQALGRDWSLPPGGELLTETSAKFRLDGLRAELAAAGFLTRRTWVDPGRDFSLTLAVAG